MQIREIIIGLVAVLAAGGASAQGFVDFSDIPGIDEEPFVEVTVTPILIAIMRGALRESDPQTAELLSKLRGIQLRSYHVSDKSRQINNFIDNVSKDLEEQGWERVVTVQNEGSRVRVLMRLTEEGISGATVMVVDGAEAFFMNVDATVSTEDLGKIMEVFKIDQSLGPLLSGGGLPAPPAPATN